MLPTNPANAVAGNENKMRYADTGIPMLISMLLKQGAVKRNLTAKIAGGAQMFQTVSNPMNAFNIGDRNVESVKKVLAENSIRIAASDTGLNYGRTIYCYVENGAVEVKTAVKRQLVIL
jgi:chemotaxis protein CheD